MSIRTCQRFVPPALIRVVPAFVLILAASACATVSAKTPVRPAAPMQAADRPAEHALPDPLDGARAATVDTIWFLTTRTLEQSEWTDIAGPLSAGMHIFALPARATDPLATNARLPREAAGEETMDVAALRETLQKRTAESASGSLVLLVHGYATTMERSSREASEMKERGAYDGPVVAFAWPARNVGITWPSRDRILSNAYWQDSMRAAESAPALARSIEALIRTVGADHLVVSSHSMGAQLLAAALSDSSLAAQLKDTPLRAVVFAAPDLDRAHFRDTVAPRAASLAKRVVVYGAQDDLMLRLSALVHNRQPRAGLLDPNQPLPSWLDVVDLTNERWSTSWLGPIGDTNHAVRRSGRGMFDLFQVVAAEVARPRLP